MVKFPIMERQDQIKFAGYTSANRASSIIIDFCAFWQTVGSLNAEKTGSPK